MHGDRSVGISFVWRSQRWDFFCLVTPIGNVSFLDILTRVISQKVLSKEMRSPQKENVRGKANHDLTRHDGGREIDLRRFATVWQTATDILNLDLTEALRP